MAWLQKGLGHAPQVKKAGGVLVEGRGVLVGGVGQCFCFFTSPGSGLNPG